MHCYTALVLNTLLKRVSELLLFHVFQVELRTHAFSSTRPGSLPTLVRLALTISDFERSDAEFQSKVCVFILMVFIAI